MAYGVDGQGRVVVERTYAGIVHGRRSFYETFYEYSGGGVNRWSVGRSLLDRVATSLRAFPWKTALPVTDDFVVYAVDFELGAIRRALRAAIAKKPFDRWVRDHLVP